MAASVYTVTAIIFIIFGSANLQPWGSSGTSTAASQVNGDNTSSKSQSSLRRQRNGKKEPDYEVYKIDNSKLSYYNNVQID